MRDLVGHRPGDRAGAGAEVDDHRARQAARLLDRPAGQQLGLGARHEDARARRRARRGGTGGAGQVLQRLPGRPPGDQGVVRRDVARAATSSTSGSRPSAVPSTWASSSSASRSGEATPAAAQPFGGGPARAPPVTAPAPRAGPARSASTQRVEDRRPGRRRAPGRGCRPCSRCGGRRCGSPGSCRCGSARSGRPCGPGCAGPRPGLGVGLVLGGGQQPGAQDPHRLLAVLQLALLVLAADHDAGRQVGDPDGGVGGVDALAAGPAAAEDVDAQVVLVDGDVDLLGLGQHQHAGGAGVDAALGLGDRHPLHAVDAALELEQGVRRLAGRRRALGLDRDGHGLVAAEVGLGGVEDLGRPAATLGVAGVHPEQVAGEQRRLLAALARLDLEEGVLGVGSGRGAPAGGAAAPRPPSAALDERSASSAKAGSSAASSRAASRSLAQRLPLLPGPDDRRQLGVPLVEPLRQALVGVGLRVGELLLELGCSATRASTASNTRSSRVRRTGRQMHGTGHPHRAGTGAWEQLLLVLACWA